MWVEAMKYLPNLSAKQHFLLLILTGLVTSMRRRCQAVIAVYGSSTRYSGSVEINKLLNCQYMLYLQTQITHFTQKNTKQESRLDSTRYVFGPARLPYGFTMKKPCVSAPSLFLQGPDSRYSGLLRFVVLHTYSCSHT